MSVTVSTLTTEQLTLNLAAAEQAYHQIMTGTKTVTASYAMADGSRSVTYNQTSAAALQGYIAELRRMLGLTRGRTAFRPIF